MLVMPTQNQRISPTRLLEMLSDRFGAFEAIANSSIKLARVAPGEDRCPNVRRRASGGKVVDLGYSIPSGLGCGGTAAI